MDYKLPILAAILLIGVVGIARGVFGVDRRPSAQLAPKAVAASAGNAVAAAAGSTSADQSGSQLIDRMLQRLSDSPTIAAKVRHRTRLFDQKLVGSGTYLQQKGERGSLSRFSLSIRTDEQMVSLLHVCDGRYLWVRDSTSADGHVSRIDIRRIREAAGNDLHPDANSLSLGGGLPRLLTALKTNFDFARPNALTFQEVPVWAVACHWKPERLKKLLPNQEGLYDAGGRLRVNRLPMQVPDRVFLLIGRDDLFPYHIDFRRASDEARTDKSHRAASHSLVTIEMFEVQFGAEIHPTAFVYRTGDIKIDDLTDEYLARVKARLQ